MGTNLKDLVSVAFGLVKWLSIARYFYLGLHFSRGLSK